MGVPDQLPSRALEDRGAIRRTAAACYRPSSPCKPRLWLPDEGSQMGIKRLVWLLMGWPQAGGRQAWT